MSAELLDLPSTNAPSRVLGTTSLEPGKRLLLADLKGPGCIRRFSATTVRDPAPEHHRQIILRMFWDGSDEPAVEAPLGDFFGLLHGVGYYPLRSRYLVTQRHAGCTAYFPMPFGTSARLEVEVGPDVPDGEIYWQIDWHRYPAGALQEPMRFHARFRREYPCEAWGRDYLILDATGPGRLIGFNYGVRVGDDRSRWSHAGSDNIFIANRPDSPQGAFAHLRGGGGEDVFGAAYGGVLHEPSTHLDQGIPYYVHEDTGQALARHSLAAYRFFHDDSIEFDRSIQVRFGSMANDICSTAYWYQIPPHREFFRLPSWEKLLPGTELPRGACDLVEESPGWWLCGPFFPVASGDIPEGLPPEAEPFDAARTFPDSGYPADSLWRRDDRHVASWKPYTDIDGFVDFSHVFRPVGPENARTYPAVGLAQTWLRISAETTAAFHVGWVNQLQIQINDGSWELLGDHAYFQTRVHRVKLPAGANRVRVKLSNPDGGFRGFSWGAWVFAFRAVLPDGQETEPQLGESWPAMRSGDGKSGVAGALSPDTSPTGL
jgi:hypothetical protein